MKRLLLVGSGEHARVVAEAAAEHQVIGYAGPAEDSVTRQRLGLDWLGDDASVIARLATLDAEVVIAVGGPPHLRARIAQKYAQAGARFARIVHPAAWVSPTAQVDPGAVVFARSAVNSGAHIGGHVIVNTGAVIEHDVHLGDFTHAAPGAVLGGGAQVGVRSHLGIGCRIRDHVRVGDDVVVGMGAAVVGDVASGMTVVGVPARPRGRGNT